MKHTTLYVYKHVPWVNEGYDPTNGGVSSRLDEIEVFSAESTDEEIREWCEREGKQIDDVCRLNKRILWGEKHYYIEPVERPRCLCGPMCGGNFADTSDEEWAQMLGETVGRPIPIHDRFETQEHFDALMF